MRLAAAALLMLLAGCDAGQREQLAVSADGKAVLRDAYPDGQLDRNWSCGSLRVAFNRLPVDVRNYAPFARVIGRAAGRACDHALTRVHNGLTRGEVKAPLGEPDRAPRCWFYRWQPDASSAVDGARLVSFIQIAEHG